MGNGKGNGPGNDMRMIANSFHLFIAASLFMFSCAVGGEALAGDWTWFSGVDGDGFPIDRAVVAGKNSSGRSIFICRASYEKGIHPGSTTIGSGCKITWGGKEVIIDTYDVLLASWEAASNGSVPPNASSFGAEAAGPGELFGPLLYVCQGDQGQGRHPGKVRPGLGGCHIGWGGHAISLPSYFVLTTPSVALDDVGGASPPPDALVGGYENNEWLYICRAFYNNGIHPGKYRAGLGGCNIGWGKREVTVSSFTFLAPHWEKSPPPWREEPFPAGNEADGTRLYACRATSNGVTYAGKYRHGFEGCYVSIDKNEVPLSPYEVLSRPPAPR